MTDKTIQYNREHYIRKPYLPLGVSVGVGGGVVAETVPLTHRNRVSSYEKPFSQPHLCPPGTDKHSWSHPPLVVRQG